MTPALGVIVLSALPSLAWAQAVPIGSRLDISQLATFAFVMLGPLKLLGPFAALSRDMEAREQRKLAVVSAVISLLALAVAATVGVAVLGNWQVSPAALLMASGIIIFLTALQSVMSQFAPSTPMPAAANENPAGATSMLPALKKLVFPTIVTPQGIALIILVVAANPALTQPMAIVVVGIMVTNGIAMVFAQRILAAPGVALTLLVFGNVLAVLQVALGLQIIIRSLVGIGALPQ